MKGLGTPSEGNPLSCQGLGSRTFSGLSLNEIDPLALPEDALSASHMARV